MAFQVVRIEMNDQGIVVERQRTDPPFGRREDAVAIAEFQAALTDECAYDAKRGCWRAREGRRAFTFIIEPVPEGMAA